MALAGWLRQSTAVTVMIGPFVDDTDGKTAETALTISQADVRLSKNAGNMAQKGDATACTHDEIGYYTCPLSTTDTGTLGILTLMVHESGALPVRMDFLVVPANVWDSFFSTDKLQVDVREKGDSNMGLTTQEKADVDTEADEALTNYDPPTRAELTTDKNSIITEVNANETKIDTVDTVVDGIQTDLDNATDGLGALKALIDALNDLSAAEVNAEVLDVLQTDTFAEPASVPAATSSLKDKIGWLFSLARNKITQTSTTQTLRNDGDSGSIGASTVSDDGTTATRGKFA